LREKLTAAVGQGSVEARGKKLHTKRVMHRAVGTFLIMRGLGRRNRPSGGQSGVEGGERGEKGWIRKGHFVVYSQ